MADRAPLLSQEMMQPTRQQLDDLEALIAQMLTLPVSPAPEELLAETTSPPATVPQAESLELAGARPLSLGASGLETFFTEPARGTAQPASGSAEPEAPAVVAENRAAGDEPRSEAPASPWLLRPLLWIDLGFVACTSRLGRAGGWLQGAGGRAAVGLTGLALLGTALAWGIVDWIRWSH